MIYLDNAASTKPRKEVIEEKMRWGPTKKQWSPSISTISLRRPSITCAPAHSKKTSLLLF